jgi:hypothetical protein
MTRKTNRMERRRQWCMSRINGSVTATDRMAAAWDYLRGALSELDEATANDKADAIATELIRLADEARKEAFR